MRVLWHSVAPWAQTGYGQQTGIFAPRLAAAGHDVAVSAYWGLNGATLHWNGLTVYPGDERWGNLLLPGYAQHHDADLVVTLMDVWVLKPDAVRGLPLACWVPIDHDPAPPRVVEFFEQTGARPIAMSRFGERMLNAAGLRPLYVPHGIDTTVYQPPTDRAAVRDMVGLPRDAFVVGMVANNQGQAPPRKAFPQAIAAFAEFRRTHPDALLYLHSEMTGVRNGVNLPELCETYGLTPDAVGFGPQLQMELGVTQPQMAALYGAMDVLLAPSYGEGFGIPIVEAQACGTPVIVSDWTAMPELCGAGWLVQGEPYWDAPHRSFFQAPAVASIVDALEQAYTGAAGKREAARAFAVGYDADRVLAEHWLPALDQFAPAAVLNREQRRQLAKAGAR